MELLYLQVSFDKCCRYLLIEDNDLMFKFSDSPFRTPISSAILQLQEGGKLHMLKEKWWKQRKGGGKCKVSPRNLFKRK